MKKFILITILLVFPTLVKAEQGDCSWHGGVDCNVGPDSDLSVICKDGWKDSSDSFTSVQECHYENNDYCWFLRSYKQDEYNEIMKDYVSAKEIYEQKLKDAEDYKTSYLSGGSPSYSSDRNGYYEYAKNQLEYSGMLNMALVYQKNMLRSYDIGKWECSNKGIYALMIYKLELYDPTDQKGYICIIKGGSDCVSKNCSDGYIKSDGKCITHTQDCKNTYGENIYGTKNSQGSSSCYCDSGYKWNTAKTACVINLNCSIFTNAYLASDNQCHCNAGYIWDGTSSKCTVNDGGRKVYVDKEISLAKIVDKKLTQKLKGRILLQIEDKGQAWYVNPKNEKKYYMANGDEAFKIMRSLGVGVTNKDLEKIKSDKKYAKKNSGKIFLQVEEHGEAYYIDIDGNAQYLKDGSIAYNTMRDLGLGISNSDLRKISIGE